MKRLWLILPFLLFVLLLYGRVRALPVLITATPSVEPRDWRFGVVESYDAPVAATDVGAAWTRVRFQWAEVQPNGADEWETAVGDDVLERELAEGRELVGLLIGIPEWARDEDDLPLGLYLSPDDPNNLWAAFVQEAITKYEGRIAHWIIWNEPDIWQKETPGHTWDGTVADFYQLQKVAYVVAKRANADAVIHLPAFTYFWDAEYGREQYLGRLLDVMLADETAVAHNYYFDVATAHLYFQPDVIYEVLMAFREMMASRGIEKPIWLVETNAPPHDDPAWEVPNWTFLVSQREQAAFVPQVLAVSLAAGAERVGVYKMQDVPGDRAANPEPFGLLREDGSRRPAADALEVATRYLAGVQRAERVQWDAVGMVRLDQVGQTTTVLFSRLPAGQTAVVPATADSAILVDMWGNRQAVTPVGGQFEVALPAALCQQTAGDYCMIGGEPFYLVQADDEAVLATATPTIAPLPTETVLSSAVLTPSVTPSPMVRPSETAVVATVMATNTAVPLPLIEDVIEDAPPTETSTASWGLVLMGVGLAVLLLLGAALWWQRRDG